VDSEKSLCRQTGKTKIGEGDANRVSTPGAISGKDGYRCAIAERGRYNSPVRRRIFTLISLLSLLLCVATVVLWVRSYHTTDRFTVKWTREYEIAFHYGYCMARISTTYQGPPSALRLAPLSDDSHFYWSSHPDDVPFLVLDVPTYFNYDEAGMGRFSSSSTVPDFVRIPHQRGTIFPVWLLVIVTSLIPVGLGLRRVVATHRRATGTCPICSYNLTGNTSGVCPECGTPIEKSVAKISR